MTLNRRGANSWSERRVIVEAAVLIGVLRVVLMAFGVRRMQRAMASCLPSGARPCNDESRQRAVALSRLVDVAARHTVRNTCLHRSLALWWMLGRRGLSSEVRFGTRRLGGRFEAHAWVECAGEAVNDRGRPGYALLVWPPLKREV